MLWWWVLRRARALREVYKMLLSSGPYLYSSRRWCLRRIYAGSWRVVWAHGSVQYRCIYPHRNTRTHTNNIEHIQRVCQRTRDAARPLFACAHAFRPYLSISVHCSAFMSLYSVRMRARFVSLGAHVRDAFEPSLCRLCVLVWMCVCVCLRMCVCAIAANPFHLGCCSRRSGCDVLACVVAMDGWMPFHPFTLQFEPSSWVVTLGVHIYILHFTEWNARAMLWCVYAACWCRWYQRFSQAQRISASIESDHWQHQKRRYSHHIHVLNIHKHKVWHRAFTIVASSSSSSSRCRVCGPALFVLFWPLESSYYAHCECAKTFSGTFTIIRIASEASDKSKNEEREKIRV